MSKIGFDRKQLKKAARIAKSWLDITLSTRPADRERAESLIPEMYSSFGGLKPPTRIEWLGSPKAVNDLATECYHKFADTVIRESFLRLWGKIPPLVQPEISAVDNLWRCSRAADDGMTIHTPENPLLYAFFDSSRLCRLECIIEMLSDEQMSSLGVSYSMRTVLPLIWMAKTANCLPSRKYCLFSENPTTFQVDDRYRLHSLQGPALVYSDGWSVYAYRGVVVPERVIQDRGSISVRDIESEANAEIRRVMMELYGTERYIRDSGAELVAKDEYGELYRKEMRGDDPLTMVKVINSTPEPDGSKKEYWLRVHPLLRPILSSGGLGLSQGPTARNAIASTFGLYGRQYNPKRET